MNNRDLSFLLIPLAAALAFYFPLTSKPGGAEPAAQEARAGAVAEAKPQAEPQTPPETVEKAPPAPVTMKDTESNAASLIYQFIGVDRKNCKGCEDDVICPDPSIQSSQYLLEFMVVTLPDPKESRLSYLFDRNLEAVQRAIEAAGYVFDRYDFPWQEKVNGGDKPAVRQPGVILYRSTSLNIVTRCPSGDPREQMIEKVTTPSGRLLVLFVIGETPTAGMDKPALKNAFDQITLLSRWQKKGQTDFKILPCLPFPEHDRCQSPIAMKCGDPNQKTETSREIRVMGPTFSGSQDSFELAVQSWLDASFELKDRPIVTVISGSATSINPCRFCSRITTPGQPRFHSTVPLSQQSIEAFKKYLLRLDHSADKGKIAILKEANTTYGQASVRPGQRTSSLKKEENEFPQLDPDTLESLVRGMVRLERASTPCPDPVPTKSEESWLIEIPFPLHISQLRVASERAKSNRQGSTPDLRNIRRPLLPLLLDEGNETNDVVPLFSKLQPASLEVEFSRVLDEINRERVQYIGIISTDVKDSIFLVAEIRKHCPNAMVFLFFADMIYFRPEVNVDLQGTVVITPYPLFGPNQFWSYPFSGNDTRFQFPTHITQGVYNATLALLGLSDHMLEYGEPFEQSEGAQSRIPSLWVTVIGRYGFMPVKLLPYFNDNYVMPLAKKAGQPQNAILNLGGGLNSKTSTTVILLLIALGLVIPVATLAQLVKARNPEFIERFPPTRQLSRSWFGEMFGDPVFIDYKLKKRCYLLFCCACLLGVYLSLMWVFLLPNWVHWKLPNLRGDGEKPFFVVKILIGIVMSFSLVSAVWLWGSVADWLYLLARKQTRVAINLLRGLMGREPLGIPEIRDHRVHTVSMVAVLASVIVLIAIIIVGYKLADNRDPSTHIFFFVRATDLNSGVSPLLPILLLGATAFLCAFCSLRRWNLIERIHLPKHWELKLREDDLPETYSFLGFEPPPASGAGDSPPSSFIGFREMERRVRDSLSCFSFNLPAWPLLCLMVMIPYIYVMGYRFTPTLEGVGFDLLFRVIFAVVMIAMTMAFLRFVASWIEMRRLLRRLSFHPLLSGFLGRDSVKFDSLPRISLTSPAPNYTSLILSAQHAIQLCRTPGAENTPAMITAVRKIEENLHLLLEAKSRNDWQTVARLRSEMQARFSALSQQITRKLESGWSLVETAAAPPPSPEWAKLAEVFLAGRILAFLHYVLAHLQNLVIFVNAGMLLLLVTVTSYPFQPRDLLLLFGWLLILSVVAATIFIFVQMDRDKALSTFSGGVPGQLTWSRDFIMRIAIHGVLPILALLSVQFPEVLQQILSWLSFMQGGGN
ncbi:MAG: hypothetical protein ACKVX9_00350 [Blastocatellia bacterium]